MARNIKIVSNENIFKIIVDGNEIKDVLAYELCGEGMDETLILKIAITGEVRVE